MFIKRCLYGSKTGVIRRNLPYIKAVPNAIWALKNPSFMELAQSIINVNENSEIKSLKILQSRGKTTVFSFESKQFNKCFVVKSFLLQKWRTRLKFRKYAFNEATHSLRARELGVNTPQIYAVGYSFQQQAGLKATVIMELVDGVNMRDIFLENKLTQAEKWGYLLRLIPSIKKLYEAGCNHVYFSPHAVLLLDNSCDDVVIDFQYAAFVTKKCANNLAYLLGHIGWAMATSNKWVELPMLDEWYSHVLNSLDVPYSKQIAKIIKQNEKNKPSTKQRLKGYPSNVISG